ncbi:hypothetical protein LZ189_00135 [Rhodovulum sulfidophilum]|nr:hypothetical protein [Rhodovulum sulfidophilum]
MQLAVLDEMCGQPLEPITMRGEDTADTALELVGLCSQPAAFVGRQLRHIRTSKPGVAVDPRPNS